MRERHSRIQWDKKGGEKCRRGTERIEEIRNMKEDGRDKDRRGKNWVRGRERQRLRSVGSLRGSVSVSS